MFHCPPNGFGALWRQGFDTAKRHVATTGGVTGAGGVEPSFSPPSGPFGPQTKGIYVALQEYKTHHGALRRVILVAGLVAAGAGFSSSPSIANHPVPAVEALACGTQVSADFTLQHDIGPCGLDGLVVTGNGLPSSGACTNYLTINLNGYDIYGTLLSDGGAGIRMGDPADELNPSAFNGKRCVEVTNTSATTSHVYDFDACVAINAGERNKVTGNIHCYSNGDGFSPSLYGEGISITDSSNNEVTGLFIGTNNANRKKCDAADLPGDPPVPNTGNGDGSPKDCGAVPGATGPFAAITIKGASTVNNIHHNHLKNNYRCFTFGTGTCQTSGVRLEGDGVENNTVDKNRITGSALDGVAFLIGPDNNTISDNIIEANGSHDATHRKGDGIRLLGAGGGGANGNTITGNRVCGNAAYGIRIDAGNTGNSVTSNKVGDGSTTDPINGGTLPVCAGNAAVTAALYDVSDGNGGTTSPCTINTWTTNSFGTEDPLSSCIS